jgi:hypothetical protein
MGLPVESRLLQFFQDAASVTPNNTLGVSLARPAHALYVGTAGNLVIRTMNKNTITFLAVPVGIFDISARDVFSTNTSAAGIVALYTTAPDNAAG